MTIKRIRTNHPNPNSLLRFFRVQSNKTLAELSQVTDVPQVTLSHMERGRFGNYETLKKVADYFGITVDALVRDSYADASNVITCPIKPTKKQREAYRKNLRLKEEQGDFAETLVLDYERKRLAGTPYENMINANFADELSSGFDLMSFENERPMYIEVKSTCSKDPTEPFFMTTGELAFARHCAEKGYNYKLYRVFALNRKKNRWALVVYSLEEVLNSTYEIDSYRVTPPQKEAQT